MATQSLSLTTASKSGTTQIDETSAAYQTMTSGAGNGSVCPYNQCKFLLMLNDTAGSVTYTIKAPTPTKYSERAMVIGDMSIAVPVDDAIILPVTEAFNEDGSITIECSDTAKIMALKLSS